MAAKNEPPAAGAGPKEAPVAFDYAHGLELFHGPAPDSINSCIALCRTFEAKDAKAQYLLGYCYLHGHSGAWNFSTVPTLEHQLPHRRWRACGRPRPAAPRRASAIPGIHAGATQSSLTPAFPRYAPAIRGPHPRRCDCH